MMTKDKERLYIGRRDFIKATAMVVVGSTLARTSVYAKGMGILSKSQFGGGYGKENNKLLCLSEFPEQHVKMIDSIRSNYGIDLRVSLIEVNYGNPWDLMESIRDEDADVLLLCLGRRLIFNYGKLSRYMGGLDIPILVYSPNQDLIMIDANFVAELRVESANVKLAISETEVIEMLEEGPSWEMEETEVFEESPFPGFIQGRKALIYGRPFDSISVPAHNLTEEYVYNHTGVEITFRPLDDLMTRLEDIDESSAEGDGIVDNRTLMIYDANGNTTMREIDYDADGIMDYRDTGTYDANGNLTMYEEDSGIDSTVDYRVNYAHQSVNVFKSLYHD